MKLSVAVTQNWAIGNQNQLLVRIPEDMKRFRQRTRGKTVVMGRLTFFSLPGAQPLKNRTNLVLSRDSGLEIPGVQVFNTVDQLLEGLAPYPAEDVFVIGGQIVYERLLPFCTEAFVTKAITPALLTADRFFPDLDALPTWQLAEEEPEMTHEDIRYRFCRYVRIKK